MSKRIEFLKAKLQQYQEELDKIKEEEKLMNEISEMRKQIINAKISYKTNKKTYKELKMEEVMNELEKTNYKKFETENGKIHYVTTDGEFYTETLHLKKHQINGYEYVSISGKSKLVHRLMWEIFNGEIPNGMEIDHIDTDRLNNNINNLRLVTQKENRNNPSTIEKYKQANKNKGAVRMRNEKKLFQNLDF